MLELTGADEGSQLKMLVHHDDAQQEHTYGRLRIAGHQSKHLRSVIDGRGESKRPDRDQHEVRLQAGLLFD